jgi:nucleotide-binding universal stress UspA family protein
MVHLWRKAKDEAEPSKVAPGVGSTGDIAVIVDGKKLDNELVRLACIMARRAKRKVHLVHIIEVPRTLALGANLKKESDQADQLLTEAMAIAEDAGCEAVAEVVQARDAGQAIVDQWHTRRPGQDDPVCTQSRPLSGVGGPGPYVLV